MLSNKATIKDEITQHISEASSACGRHCRRLWNVRGIQLHTKISVYCAITLSSLLYGCETWTLYSRHLKQLEHFHMRWLLLLCSIKFSDKIPTIKVLDQCYMTSIESLTQEQLCWAGMDQWYGNIYTAIAAWAPQALVSWPGPAVGV